MEQHNARRESHGFNRAEACVMLVAVLLLTSLGLAACGRTSKRGEVTKGISNCRQIITALRIYASDHGGNYPDKGLEAPMSSNAVFRVLFEDNILDNENIFACPRSPFKPDGELVDPYLGTYPGKFARALQPGENHWAMTASLDDSKAGSIPLVYENPASAAWPPKWNADAAGNSVRGRTWSNGIIVGMNDSSTMVQPLAAKTGNEVGLKPDPSTGKDLFEAAIDPADFPVGVVLDIEE